jgi:alkylhydroperoxidase/carboxymuconolactone decarboxylase family protein YurZ
MQAKLPPQLTKLTKDHSGVWTAYQALGEACAKTGPLDGRTRRLVKLALAIGARSEGAVHSHTRRGLEEGLSADELRHVAMLAIPTLGFPTSIAAMSWIDDIAEGSKAE